MPIANIESLVSVKIKSITPKSSYILGKRSLDILAAFFGLLLLLPLLAVVAVLIKLTSKGNVMYWQKRVGLNGRVILFPKFRSMVHNAHLLKKKLLAENEHKIGHTFKMKNDPRITRVGKFIRKFSIDELPQLWLVLTGEMTLVGPRPALTTEVAKYSDVEKQRLLVKPGLTCIWQVSGRGDLAFDEQLQMDIDYINTRSLTLDLKILLATIPAVLTGKGAY